MTLLVATRSRGKQREFAALLAPLGLSLVFPDTLGIPESAAEHDLERWDTFEENARAKARWFAEQSGLVALADDSGLEVDALGGAPGVRSKRFAGHDGPDEEVTVHNNRALLEALRDRDTAERGARYRCALVLAAPRVLIDWSFRQPRAGEEITVSGATEGRILTALEGTGGFGYDPLFFSHDLGRTFGSATPAEKGGVSHRGRAVAALVSRLRSGASEVPGPALD